MSNSDVENGSDEQSVLYTATFTKCENDVVNYATLMYVLYGLLLIPAYGIGIFMLLVTPCYRATVRANQRQRKLQITDESLVYEDRTMACGCCACCGTNLARRHLLLHLITDVITVAGCCQAKYGLQQLNIENSGQAAGGVGADLVIVGVDDVPTLQNVIMFVSRARRNGEYASRADVDALVAGKKVRGFTGANQGIPSKRNAGRRNNAGNNNTILAAGGAPGTGDVAMLLREMNATLHDIAFQLGSKAQEHQPAKKGTKGTKKKAKDSSEVSDS